MVFSDTSTSQGLCEDIDFLLGTSSSDYSLADKTRNINGWYDHVVNLILSVDGSWEWDDENFTSTRPIATTSLVASQQDYSLAGEGILKIVRVECKDSSGNWSQLEPFSQDQKRGIALPEFLETAGNPQYYDISYNSLFLYPKPNYSLSAALKIYYQRDFSHFIATDTTKAPGFNPTYHRILSYGAALDYATANTMPNKITMCRDGIAKLEAELIEGYSSRNRDSKNRLILKHEDYGVTDEDMGQESVGWSS